jgi:hypothetical protein
MMRRLSYLLLAMLLVVACSKNTEWDGPIIQLTLVNDEMLETKAGQDGTREGVYNFNENRINEVDFFFYPGGDTDSPATLHVRKEDLEKQTTYFAQLELTWDQVDKIFPVDKGYRKATVVAIVNYDGVLVPDENDLSGTALPSLEQLTLETNFANESHLQTHFVMSGSETLNLKGRTQSVVAAATVRLSRYACKITVGINVSTEVIQNGETWRPMLEGMEIYLVNGVKNATLGGEAAKKDYKYFDYSEKPLRFAYKEEGTGIVKFYFEKEDGFYTTYPTYMYPQHWDYGSETEPYLKLVIPWARQAGEGITSTQRQYYYKLILPTALSEDDAQGSSGGCFVRNNWYHLNVNVDILGVDNDDAYLEVEGKCYIYDWQDKDVVIKMAEIGRARYLSVEEPSYNLYNITESRFAYVSSHPVEISNLRVTRPYYGTAAAGSHPASGGTVKVMEAENDIYPKGSKYVLYDNSTVYNPADPDNSWLVDEGDGIAFKHDLVADYTNPNFDYSPYTISYTLLHADHKADAIYRQDQTIVQYPPIYLECTPNPDTITGGVPAHWGYVWVNNEQYLRTDYDRDHEAASAETGFNEKTFQDEHIWRVVHYSSGGTDMYKINVTVLPPDSGFYIGDPREDGVNNLREEGFFSTAKDLKGNQRTLTNYYPTENSDRTINMIAPAFRISTKYSGTEYDGTGLEQARYRCASFQENGFPAGRWRLPTLAEVMLASQLSANGVFEWQFGGNYWSANGGVNVDKNKKTVTPKPDLTKGLIRCVYDSWYWGDDRVPVEGVPNSFTWGDAHR